MLRPRLDPLALVDLLSPEGADAFALRYVRRDCRPKGPRTPRLPKDPEKARASRIRQLRLAMRKGKIARRNAQISRNLKASVKEISKTTGFKRHQIVNAAAELWPKTTRKYPNPDSWRFGRESTKRIIERAALRLGEKMLRSSGLKL